MSPSIVWFRLDLRLADQPALQAAIQRGGPVIPLYIWAPEEEEDWAPGACSRWWLHHSLQHIQVRLNEIGGQLIIRRGPSEDALRQLIRETGAEAVFWNRRYEPAIIERDRLLKLQLQSNGVRVQNSNGSLLLEPWEVQTKQGKPYQVFTPFWKSAQEHLGEIHPYPEPKKLHGIAKEVESLSVDDLSLLPHIPWDAAFPEHWSPGETGAHSALATFLDESVDDYSAQRDRPDCRGTSRLSPHLHFGEISPWQVVQAMQGRGLTTSQPGGPRTFYNEIGWREFAHHVLFHFSQTPSKPLREAFAEFPWERNKRHLKAWQRGLTGYPIVDAGMRELWSTGWMHNRVRMIVGSFLTKDLRISWQEGARWFWDTLVDADLPNNTLGWQWISGCGADAAPYFRVFNPVTQGEKFDPEGSYVRRWCPELADLPNRWIHQPFNAPPDVLTQARIRLGHDYPEPLVDHGEARTAALEAFQRIRKS